MHKIVPCITLFLFVIIPVIGFCQSGTQYFDKDWKKAERRNARYVRTYTLQPDNKYKVEDLIIEGNKLEMTGYFTSIDSSNTKDGAFVYYDKGTISSEGNYVNNKKNGEWKNYRDNSTALWFTENYKDGELDGELTSYYENGKVKRKEIHHSFSQDVIGKCYNKKGKEIPFTPFWVMPKPGYSINEYLMKNLHYPEDARDSDIEGRVIIKFVINEDGSIANTEVVKNVNVSCDAEALRVVSAMPPWEPGMKDDEKVKVYFTQPISFRLE